MATATPAPATTGLPECELRHLLDPDDSAYATVPAEHPENVTYDHDWTPGGTP
ncbi:hypothetical protein ACFQ2B_27610 [Streptomyces stramineus]|uniref:Uncharacterized protein n=1 Tax=Streptomyces stramineus TaxID=173861 RepID=A0ABP3JJX1_9ACTN